MELMGPKLASMELMGRRGGQRGKRPPGIREASVATPAGTQVPGRAAVSTRAPGRGAPSPAAPERPPTGTQAVDRAARLVTEVVHAPDSVTFTELAAATGLAKSTTSRLLDALERGGLVRRDDDGRFRPGDVFVRYAWRGGAEAGLVEVARPFLARLGAETGETVNLGVARDGLVEQIAQVDSKYLIGGTNWVGRPVPLHCAALGKVLLAYGAAPLPPGRLEARASRTLTSRAALEENLRQVRRCGYAVTDEELEPGLVAVAAPVFRDGAVVVAALSVSAPASRLTPARIPAVAGVGGLVGAHGARPVRGPRPPPGPEP
jgi:DNA-binding IclR family transcriptional regulator